MNTAQPRSSLKSIIIKSKSTNNNNSIPRTKKKAPPLPIQTTNPYQLSMTNPDALLAVLPSSPKKYAARSIYTTINSHLRTTP